MLDGLMGRGFGSKCKSLMKLTKSRIDVIRRKRTATMKFLKKDIADLLANGLDINAYGRVDGLLVESTLAFCYDYIEEACDFVVKHLSDVQKQKECPEECKEAVSSLMFAAARISDLPELRDLRQMFHERYGNSLEYFANKEFVEKLSSKPAKMESKIHLMQDIAVEFSIRWDSTAFQQRMSNPSVSALGQNYGSSHVHADNNRSVYREDSAPKGDKHKFAYKEGHELPPKYDRSPRDRKEGHVSKKTEIDLQSRREITENGYTSLNGTKGTVPRNDGSSVSVQGGRGIDKHGPWIQKEDTTPRKVRLGGSSHRNGHESPREYVLTDRTANVAPYMNPSLDPMAGSEFGKEADRSRPYFNNAIPPPYVKPYSKPKDDKYKANPVSTLDGFRCDGAKKESSARDRAYTDEGSEWVLLGDHSGHERLAGLARVNGHDHHEDDVTDDPIQKAKSIRRPSKSRSNHHDLTDTEQKPIPARKSRSKRKDDPRQREEKDEEERVIDRLLIYYSKKRTFTLEKLRRKHKSHHHEKPKPNESPRNSSRGRDKHPEEAEGAHVTLRSSSLPREHSAPSEATKVFARAASFVHPKLPDYDDLAARFASLRGR